jgi:DNA-binding Lrp family transcriptional regulator
LLAVSGRIRARCVQCLRDNARMVHEQACQRMIGVDAFDLRILAALQEDARLTNQQLAEMVGLSASQCSRRRLRLEKESVISGYHAELSAEALGFTTIAFIHVALATHSAANAQNFRALVGGIDEIQEVYALNGESDYLLKAVLRDLRSLAGLVNNVLVPHPEVSHVRSSIVLERLKVGSLLPLREKR